jgi:hypothetical protein
LGVSRRSNGYDAGRAIGRGGQVVASRAERTVRVYPGFEARILIAAAGSGAKK